MTLRIEDGILSTARYCPSPNCNERPASQRIDLLVIHNISLPPGEFGGDAIERLFTNCLDCGEHPYYAALLDLEVSAHLLIKRDGELVQFVPFHLRAWHAGLSRWQGRENCNDFSIGIELEGTDDQPYTSMQYTQLIRVTEELLRYCPQLTVDRIVGHEHIAPGRKTDPGPAFDWQRYRDGLTAEEVN